MGFVADAAPAADASTAGRFIPDGADAPSVQAKSLPADSAPGKKQATSVGRIFDDVASVADIMISFPGQAVGMAAGSAAGAGAAIGGATQQEAAQVRKEAIQKYTEANPLNNPIHRVMTYFGYHDGYEKSDIDAVMEKASGGISTAGKWVENMSGGKVLEGDFNDLANAALFLVGDKVAGKGLNAIKEGIKGGGNSADALRAKAIDPEPPGAPPGIQPDTPDPVDPKVQAAEAVKKHRDLIIGSDELKTNEQKAYELMQNGASKRTVEALRKNNPELGKTLDTMMARRADAIAAMQHTIQGEVLGPDQFPAFSVLRLTMEAPPEGTGVTAPKQGSNPPTRWDSRRDAQKDRTGIKNPSAGTGGYPMTVAMASIPETGGYPMADAMDSIPGVSASHVKAVNDLKFIGYTDSSKITEDSAVPKDQANIDKVTRQAIGKEKVITDKTGEKITLKVESNWDDELHITAYDASGKQVGFHAPKFLADGKSFADTKMEDGYEQRGIGTELYNFSNEIGKPVGAKLGPSADQNAAGKAFWAKRNQQGQMNPRISAAIATAAGITIMNQDDPIAGAMVGLAAGALMYKGIGLVGNSLAAAEFGKLGPDAWKPDFDTILNPRYLGRALQWTKGAANADTTILYKHVEDARKAGVTPEMDRKFRDYSEGSVKALTPAEQKLYDAYVKPLNDAMAAEFNKMNKEERQIIGTEIETRLAKNHKAWWESLAGTREGTGPGGFQKTPGASKGRTVFSTDDGTIITVKRMADGNGWKVTGWKDGLPTEMGYSKTEVKPGTDFQGIKIKSAKQADIEKNTPVRYVDSDLATKAVKLSEMLKYTRETEMVKGLLKSEAGKRMFSDTYKEGLVQAEGSSAIPALRNVFMPPEYAEVFGDFIKRNAGSANLLEGVKNIMIRAMMLNPVPHIANEMAHWYDSRGLTGLITPKGLGNLARTMPDAIRSVIVQDKFQTDMQKSGGMLMYPSVKNAKAWQGIMQEGLRDAMKTGDWKEMAKALGTSPARLASRISNMGGTVMWAARDIMYTQLVKEQMLKGFNQHDAVIEVGKHMPEYMIPSRIITEGKAGRMASQVLQSPLAVFSPYHYGMVKAVKEIGKEITSGQKGEMLKGLDRAAALLVGFYVLYPMIDSVNQAVFNDDNIKQRRAGPYHVMDTAGKIMDGKVDASAMAMSLLTPNPAVMGAMEALNNRYGYTGQPIRYPGTSAQTQVLDTARFAASKLAPMQAGQSMQEGRMTMEEYLYKQLDIVSTSPKKAANQLKYQEMQQRAGRAHERKMKKAYGYGDEE